MSPLFGRQKFGGGGVSAQARKARMREPGGCRRPRSPGPAFCRSCQPRERQRGGERSTRDTHRYCTTKEQRPPPGAVEDERHTRRCPGGLACDTDPLYLQPCRPRGRSCGAGDMVVSTSHAAFPLNAAQCRSAVTAFVRAKVWWHDARDDWSGWVRARHGPRLGVLPPAAPGSLGG